MTMKKYILLLILLFMVSGCSEGDLLSSEQFTIDAKKEIITPPENISFLGETFSAKDAVDVSLDENGNPLALFFEDFGYIGFADENAPVFNSETSPAYFDFENKRFFPDIEKYEYAKYEKVTVGQQVGGMEVIEASTVFELENGNWIPTCSDAVLSGNVAFYGYLSKTSDGEFEMLAPGSLTFRVTEALSGFIPLSYRDYSYYVDWSDNYAEARPTPGFIVSDNPQSMEYNPEDDYPALFSESDTVYIKAVFDALRLRHTNRATGANYAELIDLEPVFNIRNEQILNISG